MKDRRKVEVMERTAEGYERQNMISTADVGERREELIEEGWKDSEKKKKMKWEEEYEERAV